MSFESFSYREGIKFFSNYKEKMQLFAKYDAILIYVMQIVIPSENT